MLKKAWRKGRKNFNTYALYITISVDLGDFGSLWSHFSICDSLQKKGGIYYRVLILSVTQSRTTEFACQCRED